MKKLSFIVISLLLILNWGCRLEELSECDVAPPTFEKLYGNPIDFLVVKDIAETPDGSFIICGTSDEDIFLLKIDEQGNTIFFEPDPVPATIENCNSIVMTSDGGFLICGSKRASNQNKQAYFVKYDSQGKHQNEYRHFEDSRCECIIDANDGSYVFSGRIKHNNNVINTYVGRIKLNNTFPMLQSGYLPSPARAGAESAESLISVSGGYAVVGHSYNSPMPEIGTAVHFYRLDNSLSPIAGTENFYDLGNQQDVAKGVVQTANGDFILTGDMEKLQGQDVFAFRVNQNGDSLWVKQYGGMGKDYGTAIIEAHEPNQYVICGRSTSFGTDNSDNVYLSKINGDGSIVWEKTFGISGADESAHAVLRTDYCGYILVGQSISNGQSQPYIIRVDADGNI